MTTKIETFLKPFLKKEIPDIRPGDTVLVYQKIKEALKKSKKTIPCLGGWQLKKY